MTGQRLPLNGRNPLIVPALSNGVNAGERVEPFQHGSVQGFLHHPAESGPLVRTGLVLTHGAGSNCQGELLHSVAAAFAASGAAVLRCDLPFRQARPSGPPRPADAKADQDGLRQATSSLREHIGGKVFLAGHSYGGRQASMLLSDDIQAADGLLLLSYPLHPPNKPEQLRTAHWTALRTPTLFIHGAKDPFGSAAEMQKAMRSIPGSFRLVLIDGAGHDLKRGRIDLMESVVKPFAKLVGR